MVDKLEACAECGMTGALCSSSDGEVAWIRCQYCRREGPLAYSAKEAVRGWNAGEDRSKPTPANGEQVERVAKAMYDATHAGLRNCYAWEDAWEDHQEHHRDRYYKEARAAIAAMNPTPTEDARSRVKVLEEADAEVERIMSLSDAEVMAEADPSDVAWAKGVKLGTKIGLSAQADEALRWYAEQVAGCRKIGRAGDPFRQALDQDGGQRARTALGNKETDRHG